MDYLIATIIGVFIAGAIVYFLSKAKDIAPSPTEYVLLVYKEADCVKFVNTVAKHLSEGWELHGDIKIVPTDEGLFYLREMVRNGRY
jgi:hypothetical protein